MLGGEGGTIPVQYFIVVKQILEKFDGISVVAQFVAKLNGSWALRSGPSRLSEFTANDFLRGMEAIGLVAAIDVLHPIIHEGGDMSRSSRFGCSTGGTEACSRRAQGLAARGAWRSVIRDPMVEDSVDVGLSKTRHRLVEVERGVPCCWIAGSGLKVGCDACPFVLIEHGHLNPASPAIEFFSHRFLRWWRSGREGRLSRPLPCAS